MKTARALFSAALCALFLLSAPALAVEPTLFEDVSPADWFYEDVYACRESGLFTGDDANRFHPNQPLTIPETWAVLARLHQHTTGSPAPAAPQPGEDWAQPYLRYCMDHGILTGQEPEALTALDREHLALFLSRVYDLSVFPTVNPVNDIPDYDTFGRLGKSVLSLYRAGIFTGTDAYGSFSPLAPVTRAQCAAVITRLLDPAKRVALSPSPAPLTMALDFMSTSDANRVYDFDGKFIYRLDLTDEAHPVYSVTDLCGRTLLQTGERISRQNSGLNGIFQVTRETGDGSLQTLFYNTRGQLVYEAPGSFEYRSFQHGKLALDRPGNSILVVDDLGREVKTIVTEEKYWVTGPVFGNYIPVAPDEGRNNEHTCFLDIDTETVTELPYSFMSAMTWKGHDYLTVAAYDTEAGRYFYNAVDLSLRLQFPQMMESVFVNENGALQAEDREAYYFAMPGEELVRYPKAQYGEIARINADGRALRYTGDGRTEIFDLRTGEVYAVFPDTDAYTMIGRRITRPRWTEGGTVIDIFDGHGAPEREGIPLQDVKYGAGGQLLYQAEGRWYYISA